MFNQQLQRLGRHCASFDAGDEDAALDAAVCLRVLFHDTNQSTSLLTLLRAKGPLRLINTAAYPFGLCNQLLVTQPVSESNIRYAPRMDSQEGPPIPCKQRWSEERVMKDSKHAFTRKELVLYAAHKQGGAHAGTHVPPEYVFLDEYHSRGLWIQHFNDAKEPITPIIKPSNSIVYTSVRQIAFEVLTSDLKRQIKGAKPRP